MTDAPHDSTPNPSTTPQGGPSTQAMPRSYAEPGLAPSRLIFSEKTDRAVGFLARVTAIYLIIGLVLLALMVIAMFTAGAGWMYGMGGY